MKGKIKEEVLRVVKVIWMLFKIFKEMRQRSQSKIIRISQKNFNEIFKFGRLQN